MDISKTFKKMNLEEKKEMLEYIVLHETLFFNGEPKNRCPVCKDENIFLDDDYMSNSVIAHYMKCEKCESEWTDSYIFQTTTDIEASDKAKRHKMFTTSRLKHGEIL